MSKKIRLSQKNDHILHTNQNGFIMQAGILAAASIICRIIGLLYKSPLTVIIGDEGNGYYSTAYTIYTIILLVSSYSIPSAMAKVLAQKLALKEYRNAQRIFLCALIYVMGVGGVASLILYFGAPLLVMGNSIPVLRVFAPTIFIYGILGVLRGYFQAHGTMIQTSVSQILEQILNAVVSIGAAYFMIQLAVDAQKATSVQAMYGAMGSALGTGFGVLASMLFLIGIYWINRKGIQKRIAYDETKKVDSWGKIFRLILSVVTPFILSTCIYNLTTSLNQTLYLKMMIGLKRMDEIRATTEYGIFAQKAVTISNIPIALASAMSSAIIPTIAAAYEKKAVKETGKKVAAAIKVTMLLSIPAAVAIGILAKPIVWILFPQKESLDLAASLLRGLSITVVLYGLSTLTNAVLQGIGKVNVPVINALISLIIQTAVLVPVLCYTEGGIRGVMLATVVYSFMMCLLNNLFLRKYLKYKQELDRTFIRPLFASVFMAAVAYGIYHGLFWLLGKVLASVYFVNLIAFAVAALMGVLLYMILIIKLRAVRAAELKKMPKGDFLFKMAKKLRLLS